MFQSIYNFLREYLVFLLPATALALLGLMFLRGIRRQRSAAAPPRATLTLHRCNRRDALFATVITVVYALVAFFQLGDTSAPQTFHRFTGVSPSVTITLDGVYSVSKIVYYTGSYHQRDKNIPCYQLQAAGVDGTYQSVGEMSQTHGAVFHWRDFQPSYATGDADDAAAFDAPQTVDMTALRIATIDFPIELGEIALYDAGGNLIDASRFTVNGGVTELFDEQDLVPQEFTHMNSMYFDEIYHGRTAREFLQSDRPYENTHPPLGKIIISIGVALFGMTPFGWRAPGVLFGILMVPFFYVLIKNMFGKSWLAASMTAVFAFDFMHFVQTRIATIDTYGVFFTILMYFFMYRYLAHGYGATPRKQLVPLALCGLSFGLGAASKWTCFYAGGGLLVLYVMGAITEFRAHRWSVRHDESYSGKFWGRFFATVGVSALFFVIISAVIYYLSYYFFARGMGQDLNLDIVWRNQETMFNYHSALDATHPYQSAWYQWIVNARPILYHMRYGSGTRSGFAALLNPIVCWGGLGAVIAMSAAAYRDTTTVRRKCATTLCVTAVMCTIMLILIDQSTAYEEPIVALAGFAALPGWVMSLFAALFITSVVLLYAMPRIVLPQRRSFGVDAGGAGDTGGDLYPYSTNGLHDTGMVDANDDAECPHTSGDGTDGAASGGDATRRAAVPHDDDLPDGRSYHHPIAWQSGDDASHPAADTRQSLRVAPQPLRTLSLETFIIIGFFAQLLPWIPVSRCTFNYHYFPAVPFLILALAWFFNRYDNATTHAPPRAVKGKPPSMWALASQGKRTALLFTAAALLLFLVFYPVLSGATIPNWYHYFITNWLPSWPI